MSVQGAEGLLLHVLQWLQCKAHLQSRSHLPQQPCRHPDQPAASQLVLEVLLGKCSLLRGFTHPRVIFVISHCVDENTSCEHQNMLGQQGPSLSGNSGWAGAAMVKCLRVCLSLPQIRTNS